MLTVTASTTIVEVEHLVAHYGETRILDDISFTIRQSEVFYIVGSSGSGKTTLFKHMAGLLKPTSGRICYSGVDITRLEEDELARVQRGIGISFQSGALFNSLTVGDNVALPLRECGSQDEALIEALVRLKLSLVGLAWIIRRMAPTVSEGFRPLIPSQGAHPYRWNPATHSEPRRPPVPRESGHRLLRG